MSPISESNQEVPRSWKSSLASLLIPLLTVILIKLQGLYFHFHILRRSSGLEEPWLENSSLLLTLACLAFAPRKIQIGIGLAWLGCNTVILLFDTAYYRFFNDLPSLHLLPAWRQSGKAALSLGGVVRWSDLLLFLAPVTFTVTSWLVCRKTSKSSGKTMPAVALALSFIVSIVSWNALANYRLEQLQRRFQNLAIEKIFGPTFYHFYDGFEWGRVQWGAEAPTPFSAEMVNKHLSKSRQTMKEETEALGVFEGRDLIYIQLESLGFFALDSKVDGQYVMPNLRKAAKAGASFRLLDQTHLGRSADGEFIFLNSLHPPATRPLPFVYPKNRYYGLPRLFEDRGYSTAYFHPSDPSFWNSKMLAESYGFHSILFRKELPIHDSAREKRGWGLTDEALFSRVVDRAITEEKPYFYYIVTMMCHHPYPSFEKDKIEFPPLDEDTMLRRYLRCARLRDDAILKLIRDLQKTERGRRTVLALVGDHDANLPASEMKKAGFPIYPQREAVPFVLLEAGAFSDEIESISLPSPPRGYGAQMDIAPTLCHVFSLSMEESVFLGWNLFSKEIPVQRVSRVGNTMDQNGMISQSEKAANSSPPEDFLVSEMLLQGDRILEFGPVVSP